MKSSKMTLRQAKSIYTLLHDYFDKFCALPSEERRFAFDNCKEFAIRPLHFEDWIRDQEIKTEEKE